LLPLHELWEYQRVLVILGMHDFMIVVVVILSEALLILPREGPGRVA